MSKQYILVGQAHMRGLRGPHDAERGARFLCQVPPFAVRETDVSRHNGGTSGAPLKPLRDDSVLRALSSLRVSVWRTRQFFQFYYYI